jgi:peptidyl-prolyl cis-trans isomerase D
LSPAAYLKQVKLDDGAIRKYYEAHSNDFRVPEKVSVQYLTLSADQLAATVVVSPEELKKAYDDPANQSRWNGKETRRARHILLTVPSGATPAQRQAILARAQGLLAQIKAHPDQFATLAKDNSQDPGSAQQGGIWGFFARGVMTPPFENAVFSLHKGEISGPIETDFGYHLIQLEDVREATHRSLEEVTPLLTAELRKQKAAQKFAELADSFNTLVYEQSGSLQPAADKFHLPLKTENGIEKEQKTGFWANPKLQEALFSSPVLKDHRNTPAIEVAPGLLVAARITADQPSALQPLEQVSSRIEQKLTQEEASHLAHQAGEALLKDLQSGKNPSLNWSGERQLTRQQAFAGGLPAALVTPAFRLDEHHLPGYGAAPTADGGFALVRVTEVLPGRTDESGSRKEAEAGLTRAYADEAMAEFMTGLRQKATIQVLDKSVLGTPPPQ